MTALLTDPQVWAALVTLSALEVVLGIDRIDSIVTAIGMAQDIRIMIAALLIAVAIMYMASGRHRPSSRRIRPRRCWRSRSWC